MKRLSDDGAAQDVAQDIFVQLWEKRESLAIENLPAWLYMVVRFKVIKLMQGAEVGERYADELGRLAEPYTFEAMQQQDLEVVFDYAVSELPARKAYRSTGRMRRSAAQSNWRLPSLLPASRL